MNEFVYFVCPKGHLTMLRDTDPPRSCEAPQVVPVPGYVPCGASPLSPYQPRGDE